MANTVKIGISASDDGFKQSLSQIASSAAKFSREIGASGKGVESLNGALRTANKAVMDLSLAYEQLSEEARNSDFGKNLAEQIEVATQAAAQLKDLKGDIAERIKNLSSDTAGWDAAAQGINVVGSAATSLIGIYTSLAGESETAAQALKYMATVQATVNAVITIGNALQKQSALMTGISIIQTKAAAAAKVLETKATIGATAAQRVFNAVANANPYVLLATAVLAVGSALVGFASSMNDAKKEEEEMKKATEEAEEAEKRFAENVANGAADVMVKLVALRKELEAAGDSTEAKREICERYKEVIDMCGGSVDTLTGSEVNYENEFGNMQQSLIKRAIAMAKYQEAIELAKRKLQELANAETRQAQYAALSTDKLYTREEASKLGFQYFTEEKGHYTMVDPTGRAYEQEYTVGFRLSEKSKAKAVADAKAEGQRIADNLQNEIKKKLDIGNQYLGEATGTVRKTTPKPKPTHKPSSKSTSRTTPKNGTAQEEKTALEKLNKLYDDTAKKLENIKGDDAAAKQARRKIYDDLIAINKQRLEFYDPHTPVGFDNIKKLMQDILNLTDETSDEYKELQADIVDINNERIKEIMSTGTTVDNVKKILPLLDENLEYLEEGSAQWEATKKAAQAYKEAVSEIDSEHLVGTLGWLQDVISNKQELQLEISIDNLDELKNAANEIHDLTAQQNIIQLYIEMFNIDSFKQRYTKLLEQFKGNVELIPIIKKNILDDAANELSVQFEALSAGIIDFDTFKKKWDDIIEYLSSNKIDTSRITKDMVANMSLSTQDLLSAFGNSNDESSYVAALKGLKTQLNDIGATSREVFDIMYDAGTNAFNDLQMQYDKGLINEDTFRDECKKLAEILKEELGIEIEFKPQINEPAWKENVDIAAQSLSSLGDAMSNISQIGGDEGTAVAGIIAKAIANIALGAAQATVQASATGNPFVWLGFAAAAMAEMTAMISSIHSATGMANGGIVGGSTTMGDKIVTRLNRGEMILNKRQQANLFKALDEGVGTSQGYTVSNVRIKGSDIYLALKNYSKIKGKSGLTTGIQ